MGWDVTSQTKDITKALTKMSVADPEGVPGGLL